MSRETLEYLATFVRFPVELRRCLKHPPRLADARKLVADRLANRAPNFLRLARRSIYDNPGSPYLALLRLAGCEYGDLEQSVGRHGLDHTLTALRGSGVYVTYDEFRGRSPIVRGGTAIEVHAGDFNNPRAGPGFEMTTGGSTGRAMAVHQDVDYIAASGIAKMLMLDAWGVADLPALHWQHILPGAGFRFVLQRASFGAPSPHAWYSQHGWFDSRSWLKYDLATLYTVFWMNACGIRVPIPKIVKPRDAIVVARHLRRVLDEHRVCLLYSGISAAVRVALAAEAYGIDLSGTTMRVGGEPITAAKAEAIRRVGARVLPTYGAIETGPIGIGCPRGSEPDHLHLVADSIALVPHAHALDSGEVVQAFNITSLLDSTPKVMLNYQIDDHGVMEQRRCGCPLYECGYTTSLHTIRSYTKLLSEGVTLPGVDIQSILEHTLPARFGGTPLDYQLLEDEDDSGLSRLHLIVSPRLAIDDESEVVRVFLEALRGSSARGDSTGNVWQHAGTLSVLRCEPLTTARGKQPAVYRRRSDQRVRT